LGSQAALWTTSGIFAFTYACLALGRVPGLRMDRAGIAFFGAAAMLACGVLTIAQATSPESINYETIFLLFGMMVVVGFMRIGGTFTEITLWTLRRIKTPRALLLATILLGGVLSAFLVNDIVCVALAPLLVHLTRRLRFNPLPHLIGLATAANIGSAGTITGNPQNMIIGVQSRIPYLHFALHLLPVSILGLGADFLVLAWVYRRSLAAPADQDSAFVLDGEDKVPQDPVHRRLRRKSEIVALITVVLFFTGLPIAVVALAAAAVLMFDRLRPDRIYSQIDWGLLLMFVGLFIVVHAFQIRVVNGWHIDQWQFLQTRPVDLLSVAAAFLSNLVSNVPAVLLLTPVVKALPHAAQAQAWLALAMSSTLAGNFTLLGSVANLIVVESARREGINVSFWEYSRGGIPITLITLALGIGWLTVVRY
jgi:Na+/H+ antiporter NhaD/arsenite permease-like protein